MKLKESIELFSALIGIVGSFYIFDDFKDKLISSLIVFIIIMLFALLSARKEYRKLQIDYDDLKKRHTALSEQYKLKESKLATMRDYWRYLGYLFISIKQNKQIDRLGTTFDLYTELSSKLNDEFMEDE